MFLTLKPSVFRSVFPRISNDIFNTDWFGRNDEAASLTPAVDIKELDNKVLLTADFPGLTEKDIKVEYKDGVLTLSGERKEEKKEENASYYTKERFYGSFSRSFTLSDSIDADKIKAKFKNGTLEVEMPKAAKKQSKLIPIA